MEVSYSGVSPPHERVLAVLVDGLVGQSVVLPSVVAGTASRGFEAGLPFVGEELSGDPVVVGRSPGGRVPLGLAMIDLDEFKNFNDSHGHVAGDELLSTMAAILAANVRDHDMAAIWRRGVVLRRAGDRRGRRVHPDGPHPLRGER